jgi:cyclophilin family peptidyl-prolyl cis-trans isomerase
VRRWAVPVLAGVVLILAGCGAQTTQLSWPAAPAITLKPNTAYTATIKTSKGTITIDLFARRDPVAVNNFVFLADHGFYNGLRFFRVVSGFMVQTGDPSNNGTGGPGYRFGDELPPTVPYAPGVVAMANSGANTNGSQFFICTGSQCNTLPANYTELGKVTSGLSVAQSLAAVAVTTNPVTGSQHMPVSNEYMRSVTIHTGPEPSSSASKTAASTSSSTSSSSS